MTKIENALHPSTLGRFPFYLQGTGTLTVSVVDENDNVPACAQNSYTESILETTGNRKRTFVFKHSH